MRNMNVANHPYLGNETATVVFGDLDNFSECMQKMGWTEYHPNRITAFLTEKAQRLIKIHQAVHLWGLDPNRGTEEFILAFFQAPQFVKKEMEQLQRDINDLAEELGAKTSLSIGMATGKLQRMKPLANNSKKELKKDPTVFLAYKALRKAKKSNKSTIVLY